MVPHVCKIIRGKNECRTGGELIEKLDKRVANDARLREKISFFVIKDPFPNPEEQMLDPLNWPQVRLNYLTQCFLH
jgi:hypothetical protein